MCTVGVELGCELERWVKIILCRIESYPTILVYRGMTRA